MLETLVQIQTPARLPDWLRKPDRHHESVQRIRQHLRGLRLHTVCESARCPNLHECFHRGTATFMILGDLCTRGCGFCAVPKAKTPPPPDPDEPANVARMAALLGLRHVVITSVNRDDLPDGGAAHFARTIVAVRRRLPHARIEALTPDFCGNLNAVAAVLEAGPDIFNHNVETVPRLYRRVRPQARYEQSLEVLRFAKQRQPDRLTKSGLMLGLGEQPAEVEALLHDLRAAEVDIVTIGQYLQPTRRNLPVARYVEPAEFEAWRRYGLALGFRYVWSGPLVRSSYMADAISEEAGARA
ncbi:MAG: lipoyl synthase [Bryobacterales bacterium]|nr:lipoyl synthase [Bryobacteraceae bacterium]MDW8355742.1 lipoyl synthase [Bryobacterales bacterium]